MSIRRATVDDVPAIHALIASVAHFFTLDPQGRGAETFLETMATPAIAGYVSHPRYHYLVACQGNTLAGVAALRDGTHLFHMFVAPAFQRQGVARALWVALLAQANTSARAFTVNSTPYAVPFYARLGFVATGPQVEAHGIAFVPMQMPHALSSCPCG